MPNTTPKVKLSPAQKELLYNIQGGCKFMWSYKYKCYWRYDGKWTVSRTNKTGDTLLAKGYIKYVKDGRHEEEKVARYELTELGKSL